MSPIACDLASRRGFSSKLVPNVAKLGLLGANDRYLRRLWDDAGLLRFESAEDTASVYTDHDAVAQDRSAAITAAR